MYTSILVAAALLPAIVLCIYVFRKDRVEKEPVGLLLLLLAAGVFICFPTMSIGEWLEEVIEKIFLSFATEIDGTYFLSDGMMNLYIAVDNFIGVALVEEGLKWTALLLITKNNKNFNSLFDGMIYAIFISLGFAGFENILYTMNYGMDTALVRMVTAVPGHMFDAVFMGYYYSWYHIRALARNTEMRFIIYDLIPSDRPKENPKKDLVYSLLVPVLAHGFYDFCCSIESPVATLVFMIFLVYLYFTCFARIHKMSKADSRDSVYVLIILRKKYKEIASALSEYVEHISKLHNGEELTKRITADNLFSYMLEKKSAEAEFGDREGIYSRVGYYAQKAENLGTYSDRNTDDLSEDS